MKIGQFLQQKSVVSSRAVKKALLLQKKTGIKLGEALIYFGLKPNVFYQNLASNLGLGFTHLSAEVVKHDLIDKNQRHLYEKLGFIPFAKEGDVVKIASCNPRAVDLTDFLQKNYGDNYQIIITTKRDIKTTLATLFAKEYEFIAKDMLASVAPENCAKNILQNIPLGILLFLTLLGLALYYSSYGTLIFIFCFFSAVYLLNPIFKIFCFFMGMRANKLAKNATEVFIKHNRYFPVIKVSKEEINSLENFPLPIYTVLVPMYKENEVTIKNIIKNISAISYPKHLLDVKLIIEKNDAKTLDLVKKQQPNYFFDIILVPKSFPQTKPKACNYALNFARGEFVTIYDAEDKPDIFQLKKSVLIFKEARKAGIKLACIQARLNFYNADENMLSRLFAMEYSGWFDFTLPGLNFLGLPVPLGGTSNHFCIKSLKAIHNWDAYNVTEDADIGIRLKQKNYHIVMMESETAEEAVISVGNWIHQRSRWIKGFIQTFLVHSKNLAGFIRASGIIGFTGFILFIGMPVLIFLSIPFLLILGCAALWFNADMPSFLLPMMWGNLSLVLVISLVNAVLINKYGKGWKTRSLLTILVFPFYFILHSIAAIKAVYDIIVNPYKWNKTAHGVSKTLNSQKKSP